MSLNSVAEFKLSITKALADQLAETLDPLTPSPLSPEILAKVEGRPGVYMLFLDGRRVYVGKTAKTLPARLKQHWRKISGRTGISVDHMSFVCVYVDRDMDSVAPEKMLISKYAARGGVPWNNNGFGNKDPGAKRDHSLVKINHFDADYPIDLDTRIEYPIDPKIQIKPLTQPTVSAVLKSLKKALPFNLRYDTSGQGKAIMNAHSVTIPPTATTFREIIQIILEALPSGWQATALPGYVTLYRKEETYQSATGWWRKEGSEVVWHTGPAKRDPSEGPIKPDDEIMEEEEELGEEA
ncbi:GIY-YIG nuclease family protein [Streptosporangium sp. NPDC048047]|uniref:GIY-YIG nuclease family protein n=1 Tax=Streptosporangium sp. NPDC048047 TaxID=3155748 RepID=UPI00344A2748